MATVTQQLAALDQKMNDIVSNQQDTGRVLADVQAALAKIGPADDAASLDAIRALAQSIADAIGVGPSQDGNTTVPPAPVTPPTPGPVVVPPAPNETTGNASNVFPNLNPTPASPI